MTKIKTKVGQKTDKKEHTVEQGSLRHNGIYTEGPLYKKKHSDVKGQVKVQFNCVKPFCTATSS